MKRLIVLAVVVVALLGLFVGTVQWRVHSDHPESLVRRLRKAKNQEQRERLIMKLNLSKKDPVGPLLKALETSDKDPNFRMGILEILFKRQLHAPEDRIKAVLGKSLEDADVVLRRKATELFATYVVSLDSRALAERIHDTDSEVRRHAYEVFASNWYTYRGAWVDLVEGENDKRKELVEECRNRMTTEKDPDLRFMARAIVGRQIWDMCRKARETLQGGDIVEAEDLLNKALELDPENHRARIRMVRHHLMTGNKEKALTLADQHGALLRIPVLASAPVVNGDPTEQAWHDAFTSDRFYLTLSAFTGKPAQGKSQFHIGHYEGKIYVAVLGYEDNLDELVIKHTQRDSAVWMDDCAEIFFDPSCTEKEVYQFIINAAGAFQDNFQNDPKVNVECEHAAQVFKDRGYWACEFAVDATAFDGKPITQDSVWGINISRVRIGVGSEHCQWWPTFVEAHNYHLFPIAVFEME